MKIQVINYDVETQQGEYTYSTISKPRALDEFSINIVDLGNEQIWHAGSDDKPIDIFDDIVSLAIMIKETKSKVVISFPQDINFCGTSDYRNGRAGRNAIRRIKDVLPFVERDVLDVLLSDCVHPKLIYENTSSTVGMFKYDAAFSISHFLKACVKSNGGEKGTFVGLSDRVYLTTLDFLSDEARKNNLIESLFPEEKILQIPEWAESISFGDDPEQKKIIKQGEALIEKGKELIARAEDKLAENKMLKSILYTNGDNLVKVVFHILEQLLECDLSKFTDEKKEDFLIKHRDYTLIGEIKGVTSNVKSEHISQLEIHYQEYLDLLEDFDQDEKVCQVLIINPFRNKPISERDPIHEKQVSLAKRNKALIIETYTLLRLYEKYIRGEVSNQYCQKLFVENTGILRLDDNEITGTRF